MNEEGEYVITTQCPFCIHSKNSPQYMSKRENVKHQK